MAKREQWWVAKRDMTLNGQTVSKGQLIRPSGALRDHQIFGDNTHWTYRLDMGDGEPCGTDGCTAAFDNLGSLAQHRRQVHAPERDERQRAEREAAAYAARAEERGDTIGGHEIVAEKAGPRGSVPYIAPLG